MSFREFFEAQEIKQVMWTIYQNVRRQFDQWLAEYQDGDMQAVHDIMNNEGEFLHYLDEFTSEYYDFSIREEDGIIVPERITSENRPIIGDLPIAVYHHSTDAIDHLVQMRGLQSSNEPGVDQVNPYLNSSSGVYVTTEIGGNAVDGYHSNAITHHGGNERTWEIITTVDRLTDDPDDEDLAWSAGRQFILPYVDPSQITKL